MNIHSNENLKGKFRLILHLERKTFENKGKLENLRLHNFKRYIVYSWAKLYEKKKSIN